MAEEQEFEVVDRRRVRAGGSAAASPESAEGAAEPAAAETGGPDEAEDQTGAGAGAGSGLPQMDFSVTTILATTVTMLHERAWISLGLTPDPFTERIQQDLPEARRAINVLADLVKHIEPDATPEEKRELQNLLATLRANYVRQANPG